MAKDPTNPKLSVPKNYFKIVQDTMTDIMIVVLAVLLLNSYLSILGLELSQTLYYSSSLSLSYDSS